MRIIDEITDTGQFLGTAGIENVGDPYISGECLFSLTSY
jgi:hypothetical protein